MAESAAQPAATYEYPPLRGGKLLFLTAAIATASFMEILDMTIVNVSVPAYLLLIPFLWLAKPPFAVIGPSSGFAQERKQGINPPLVSR